MSQATQTTAEDCASMEAKGWLTSTEALTWVRPYCVVVLGPDRLKQTYWAQESLRFYLDGRIMNSPSKRRARQVGRWAVSVQGHRRVKEQYADWQVRPERVFDPVFLHCYLAKLRSFRATVIRPFYTAADAACREALPDGGTIRCNPFGSGGQTRYYQTVRVPTPRANDPNYGLSFGSESVELKETHPLRRLGEESAAWDKERSWEALVPLGEDMYQAWRRMSRHDLKSSLVHTMLFNALCRHLPSPWASARSPAPARPAEFRVLDTTYFFSQDPASKHGWVCILTLVDGEEGKHLRFNFQDGGKK